VGVPRSGTTLLRLMLDAHPALAIPPETHFVPRFAEVWAQARRGKLAAALEEMTLQPQWRDLGFGFEELAAQLRGSRSPGAALRRIYLLYAQRQGKPRWGDKTPRYLQHMEVIRSVLPEARFVHIIRDGRDVALSLRGVWFGADTVRGAARTWAQRIEAGRASGRALGGYLEVRYEALVAAPEHQLRRVCEFVALDFDPAMLEYHRRADARMEEEARDLPTEARIVPADERRALHTRLRLAPDAARVGRWREEMSRADRRAFMAVAGRTLRSLGYR